jgi:hypothetical protein
MSASGLTQGDDEYSVSQSSFDGRNIIIEDW